MSAQRSDGHCAEQAEYETAIFERVGHSKYTTSETALYQM